MHSGRGVRALGHCLADGTIIVVKNCSVEVEEESVDSGLNRSSSDGDLRCAVGGPLDRDHAAGRLAHADDGHTGSTIGSTTGHEPLPVSPEGDACSWGEFSDCSRFNLSGCSGYDSQDESCGSSSLASGSSQSACRSPLPGEQSKAEWLRAKEKQHAAGTCKPCLYFNTRVGCTQGLQCSFCHLSHERKLGGGNEGGDP
ncbi:unnamed protein product [Prorocentrum cordatum]|uniref:C3H1-type domain-containing protein n=1 Tax=Prorocentrum cordatum TaxID=2364126 RepID=A0ABN9VTA9_9DINO|nr:unnamed protein product [Polarella glacialis]